MGGRLPPGGGEGGGGGWERICDHLMVVFARSATTEATCQGRYSSISS